MVNEKRDKSTDAELKQFYSSSRTYLDRLKAHDEQAFALYIQLCKSVILADSLILECGCGTGFSSYLLARAAFRVVGMDISPLLLSEVIAKYGNQKGLKIYVGDASKMPFPDQSFDTVCSHDLLEHVTYVKTVLSEIDRVVKRGGVIIIIAPNHLDPIQHLKVAIKWRKKDIYKPWEARHRLLALYKFIRSSFLVISKAIGLNKKIYYLDPVLSDDKDVCGLKEFGFSIKDALFPFEDRIIKIMKLLDLHEILLSFYTKMRSRSVIVGVKK